MSDNSRNNKKFNSHFPDMLDSGYLKKYDRKPWFTEIVNYLISKYSHIEERFIHTFRYVQLHKDNENVFSNEYSSILRDCGSVFSSVLDKTIKNLNPSKKKILNFNDYRKFLLKEVPEIAFQTIPIRLLIPFRIRPYVTFRDLESTPKWWNGYNNVKHSDIDNYRDGNFKNTINAIGALAFLQYEMTYIRHTSLFINVGMTLDGPKGCPPELIIFQDI